MSVARIFITVHQPKLKDNRSTLSKITKPRVVKEGNVTSRINFQALCINEQAFIHLYVFQRGLCISVLLRDLKNVAEIWR